MLVERMALALQASVLLRANAAIAPLFVESRLQGAHGLAFGTLRADDATFETILARALP
jgi:putative acyl-CoA dehydrogenase